jgi:hypothetical protein
MLPISSHLHIITSPHFHIITSSHHHISTFPHLHIFTFSHLHISRRQPQSSIRQFVNSSIVNPLFPLWGLGGFLRGLGGFSPFFAASGIASHLYLFPNTNIHKQSLLPHYIRVIRKNLRNSHFSAFIFVGLVSGTSLFFNEIRFRYKMRNVNCSYYL